MARVNPSGGEDGKEEGFVAEIGRDESDKKAQGGEEIEEREISNEGAEDPTGISGFHCTTYTCI